MKYLNNPDLTERTMREMMRGAQVQEQKARFGAEATVGKTDVYKDEAMREKIELDLMRRDRATTLYRWLVERRLYITEDNASDTMQVTIVRRNAVLPGTANDEVVFVEKAEIFPSVKLMADVALAMVGMGV